MMMPPPSARLLEQARVHFEQAGMACEVDRTAGANQLRDRRCGREINADVIVKWANPRPSLEPGRGEHRLAGDPAGPPCPVLVC